MAQTQDLVTRAGPSGVSGAEPDQPQVNRMAVIKGMYNRDDERIVWVLKTYQYHGAEEVGTSLIEKAIAPVELKKAMKYSL